MVKFFQYLIPILLLTAHCSQGQTCHTPWSNTIQLSDDNFLSFSPRIAGSHETIHVIWFNLDTTFTSADAGIYYTRSEDSGHTFTAPVILLNSSVAINAGILIAFGRNVVTACYGILDTKTGTVVCRSTDGGATWLTPQLIHEKSFPQTMTTFNSHIIIQFASIGSISKGILLSQDNGATWQVVNSASPQFSDMTATQELLHAVGPANRESGTEVGYYYSINEGRNWYGPDIISSDDRKPSLYPKIAASGDGTLYVTWHESGTILLRRSGWYDDENTLLWDPPVLISEGTSNEFPDIAVNNRIIAAAWERREGDQYNVNFRYSGNGGTYFCPLDFPSPSSEGSEPALLSTGNTVHIVWNSQTSAGAEIFYRQGILEEFLTGISPILRQSYPNPASAEATIEFELQSPELAEIILYNLLGQKVMTLFKGTYGPGTYSVPFKVSELGSGVYFYRLTTRNSGDTKKLIILR